VSEARSGALTALRASHNRVSEDPLTPLKLRSFGPTWLVPWAGNSPTYNGPDAGPAIGLDETVYWGNGYPYLGLGIASTTFYAFSVNGK